jgi:ATP-dependent helicase/nuclease subunit B
MAPHVFTIPAGMPFADTLARGIVLRFKAGTDPLALSRATIFLPTRRATSTLATALAKALGGVALLPDIRALGEVSENDALFEEDPASFHLPPEVTPLRQRCLLATLVQRWDWNRRGGTLTFIQAMALARGLADFLSEVEIQGVDLAALDHVSPAGLTEHWAEVRDFLLILRDQWPTLLAAEKAMNPAARRNAALESLAQRMTNWPPDDPVIAAGSTGSIPATAALLRVIANLPNGAVVLPGLDRTLDEESWNGLDPGHPQYGMREVLSRIGIARNTVTDWTEERSDRSREALLREVLRPAPTTDAWRDLAEGRSTDIAAALSGLTLLEAVHPGEEAVTISLLLREILETPGKTAAVITPDRDLARRVAAELERWKIAIDDSAGQPLAHTPPGAFLCLLAEAAEAGFAPVHLLALLKHPLAAGGIAPHEFRAHARVLDHLCLRGPAPDPGLGNIKSAIAQAESEARDDAVKKEIARVAQWFADLSEHLADLEAVMQVRELSISEAVRRHVAAAEALAATDSESGPDRLWHGDAGEAAAAFVAALADSMAGLPNIEPRSYPSLFRGLATEHPVRPTYGRHPRLAILGPLEARLQSFDLIVLGGLNEGTWPQAVATDAWLSRPMREKLGLEQPERMIGLAAHDFAVLAAAPRVVLTRSLKVEGSPTVASRWWQRLIQLAKGLGVDDRLCPEMPYDSLARLLDVPDVRKPALPKPAPRPPVARRPRSLSVTETETWLRDPYAIYAKHVLSLAPLDPLDAQIGPLERGTAVHRALERFLIAYPDALPADAEMRLIAIAGTVFDEMKVPKAARALWYPRFIRAARWFVSKERTRREVITQSFVEIHGQREFHGPAGPFTLRARADRIDALRAGGAAIVDYKTGNPPTKAQVNALLAPQLPLEGAILAQGGFAETGSLAAVELLYVRFGGGAEPGEIVSIPGDISALVMQAEKRLSERIAAFDSESMPYFPRVMPVRADQPGDYDHLARVREWSLAGWESDSE